MLLYLKNVINKPSELKFFFYYQKYLSDETNPFGGMSDSQGKNKQDIEEDSSIQQEQNNGKNLN